MQDGTILNMVSETPQKKIITRDINFINPEASEVNMAKFVSAFAGLSKNKLKGLHKTVSTEVPLPDDD